VRVSGGDAHRLASERSTGEVVATGASRGTLRIGELNCPAWVYSFKNPRSYTGEDLVEFHLPGNPLLARMLMDDLLRAGARSAEPGEFTARAYFNGRLDLAEAEGVSAMISAHSEQELRAARQLLSGELARRLRPIMETVAEMLALVEVGIDFSEEQVTFLSAEEIGARIDRADDELAKLAGESERFERLSHEPTAVLVGRPNAGKSSLLNALAGRARAVVSPIAGTTRDAISAEIALRRGIIRLIDVAGVEESPDGDVISKQMHERALEMVATADLVLLVRDSTDSRAALILSRDVDLTILTKSDLLSGKPREGLAVSALRGDGLSELREKLDALSFGAPAAQSLALNARHHAAIDAARVALDSAKSVAPSGQLEFIALNLRQALDALGEILGNISPDDVLGKIFSRFCMGK